MSPVAIPAADLLTAAPVREFILLAGKDGSGKTSAILSLAEFVSQMDPAATFWIIDTENKLRVTLSTWGAVPSNIQYFKCDTMNDVTNATEAILAARKPGDWLAVESMARIWERAQDLGYAAITGTGKADYMEKRRGNKSLPVTPRPEDLWSVVKGAHDSAFLDLLCNTDGLNVVLSTTMSRPPKERAGRKESQERLDFRAESGIDLNLDGAPRLPAYVQTGCLLTLEGGRVSCRVWRDNRSPLDDARVTFEVPTRRDWAMQFWAETGR